MAAVEVKSEDSTMGLSTDTANVNHWVISRVIPKRRKAIPQKRPKTYADTNSHLARRRRLSIEDHQNDQRFVSYSHTDNGLEMAPRDDDSEMFPRGREVEVGDGEESVANLRAELEWYKKENKELKKKLEDALNVQELEKTLRMTLHSFGVPIPENLSSITDHSESPKQHDLERQQMTSTQQHDLERQQMTSTQQHDYERQQMMTITQQHDHERQQMTSSQQHDQEKQQMMLITQQHDQQIASMKDEEDYVMPEPEESFKYKTPKREKKTTKALNHKAMLNGSDSSTQETYHGETQVELLPGSGIFVDSSKLSSIAFKKGWSYTLLTRNLMPMVFTKEEMATSCVRGERATGKGAMTSPSRPALDQMKVQAIINFVSSQFLDIQPYQITQTMNQKLVDVRGTIHKQQQAAKRARGQQDVH